MKQKLWIEGKLPSLNEYITEIGRHHHIGGKYKDGWMTKLVADIRKCKIKPVYSCRMTFIWIEDSQTRDKDNISGLGRKFIFDALVHANILPNDGWKHIICWDDHFCVSKDKTSGVIVWIDDLDGVFTKESKKDLAEINAMFA